MRDPTGTRSLGHHRKGLTYPTAKTAAEPRGIEELLPEPQTPGRIEWVFENGKWKPVQVGGEPAEPFRPKRDILESVEPSPRQTPENIPSDFGLGDLGRTETVTRVIKIPVDRLLAGDTPLQYHHPSRRQHYCPAGYRRPSSGSAVMSMGRAPTRLRAVRSHSSKPLLPQAD